MTVACRANALVTRLHGDERPDDVPGTAPARCALCAHEHETAARAVEETTTAVETTTATYAACRQSVRRCAVLLAAHGKRALHDTEPP